MENQDNSFWRSNIKSVPGRPSPKKEIPKPGTSSSTSFERYQKSVSDAWTLSEDELTKEYCILRRAAKPPKAMTIGVHRHQTSSSAPTSSSVINSATIKNTATSNNNNSADTSRDENENQPQRKVSETQSEKSIEYG
jgi:TBC1 domain family member 2